MTMVKRTKLRPASVVVFRSMAHLVRQVASEQGISYEEMSVAERDDLIRLSFESMDDATTRKLVFAIPREARAYRAIIGGGPPQGER